MLSRITISNYALIDDLTVTFEPGLNIITGETGAGKSVILGALSLILGGRADYSTLRRPDKKCIIEGSFHLDSTGLESFFSDNDLDYDEGTIIRREISASGKSRAFVNDTPVTLQQLHDLTSRLIDIHSQHQNLELNTRQFQLQLIDSVAQNHYLLNEFRSFFREFQTIGQELELLRHKAAKSKSDLDYFVFQFNQLEEARLQPDEQWSLEEERNALTHSEDIKSALEWVTDTLMGDHNPLVPRIKESMARMEKISGYLKEAGELAERLRSVQIELNDLAHETQRLSEKTAFDPRRLTEISERLDLIYTLEQKHQLPSVEDLIRLRKDLDIKIREIGSYDDEIHLMEVKLANAEKNLKIATIALTGSRKKVLPAIESKVTEVLKQLGIPHARFKIEHDLLKQVTINGGDDIQFLFSANRDAEPAEISRIASGGEISRVMLALKTLISDSRMLSTIIFDEIDSGISGETSMKMGSILKSLSKGIQVINITHLPQIAGKGDHHFQVFKEDNGKGTFISIRKLNQQERIEELAHMVGGDEPSEAARKTAREMLSILNPES
jgi:DNA repair protein RecN (Recombination protein N)